MAEKLRQGGAPCSGNSSSHHSGELPSSLDSSSSAGGLSMGEESSFLEDLQAPADSSLSRIDDFAAQVMVPHSHHSNSHSISNVRGSASSTGGGGYSSSDLSMLTASSQNSLTLRDISAVTSAEQHRNASWTTGASGDLPRQISNSISYEINVESSSTDDNDAIVTVKGPDSTDGILMGLILMKLSLHKFQVGSTTSSPVISDGDDDNTTIVMKHHKLRVRYPLQEGNGAKAKLKTLVESAVNDLLVSKKSQYQSPSNPHRGDDDMLVSTCRILMKAAAAQTSSNARLNSASRTLQMRRKASEASKVSSSASTAHSTTTRTSHGNSASSLMNLSSSHPQHQKAFETSIRSLRSDTSAREEDDDDLPPSFWKDVPSLSKSHNSSLGTRSTSLVPHDSDQESSYADDDTNHEDEEVQGDDQEQAPGAFPAPGLPEGVVRHRNSRISRFGRWVSSVTESASNTSLASMVEKEKSEQLAIAAEVVEKEAIDEKIRQDIEANVRRKIIQESKQA